MNKLKKSENNGPIKRKISLRKPESEGLIVKGYLANQFGFSETGRYLLDNKIRPRLVSIGLTVNDPFIECGKEIDHKFLAEMKIRDKHNEIVKFWNGFNTKVTAINNRLMQDSDCMLAILDGGADIDSGVASEMGYYAGISRGPIFALRSDFRLSENIAATINAQVMGYILMSKGKLIDVTDGGDMMDKWFGAIEEWHDSFVSRKESKKK